ncbi:MAG: PIN domain-containing protein [SAR324 cluster bacterium]|nr:PIN domain-containing protein [SAR324 cluster bacterium]
MNGVLIDTNIVLDVFEDDPNWGDWSESMLNRYADTHTLCINPIIYTEISIGFQRIEELERAIVQCGFELLQIPKEALFLAGKVFIQYRKRKRHKIAPLPDFYIGAHAAVTGLLLMTRDTSRIKTYFPSVQLIFPE